MDKQAQAKREDMGALAEDAPLDGRHRRRGWRKSVGSPQDIARTRLRVTNISVNTEKEKR